MASVTEPNKTGSWDGRLWRGTPTVEGQLSWNEDDKVPQFYDGGQVVKVGSGGGGPANWSTIINNPFGTDPDNLVVQAGVPLTLGGDLVVEQALLFGSEGSLTLPTTAPLSAPGALTATATASAGNPNGTYTYKITFVTAFGETTGGTASNSVSPASKTVSLTAIPVGPTGTTARKIYRIKTGGTTYYLLTTIANNSGTTYTDDTADASLGAAVTPLENTAWVNLTAGKTYYDTAGATEVDTNGRIGNRLDSQALWLDTLHLHGFLWDTDNYAFTFRADNGDDPVAFAAQEVDGSPAGFNFLYGADSRLSVESDRVLVSGVKLMLAASTTGYPSLNIPAGTEPTSPVTGDVWNDGNLVLKGMGVVLDDDKFLYLDTDKTAGFQSRQSTADPIVVIGGQFIADGAFSFFAEGAGGAGTYYPRFVLDDPTGITFSYSSSKFLQVGSQFVYIDGLGLKIDEVLLAGELPTSDPQVVGQAYTFASSSGVGATVLAALAAALANGQKLVLISNGP